MTVDDWTERLFENVSAALSGTAPLPEERLVLLPTVTPPVSKKKVKKRKK